MNSKEIAELVSETCLNCNKVIHIDITKELYKAKLEEREKLKQIVIEDVPHKYQTRLLGVLNDDKYNN